ncbi:DUF2129 domain-containing protein [Microaerobacter geothermalis]|uniref:YlbG family protein n=1 Tax=Microaerobacter geothermalis TaxID=674972 RepID=UPI001F2D1F4C|nr:DUF2129 domain-containing protein [Microaerobacter geothermalis]MCF6094214.1 DUF2129 domain-containing protein [Microaerobacter geothermalis]
MIGKRIGLAVWVNHAKSARLLKKYGNIHYISRRMKYVIIYVDADKADQVVVQLEKLNFVSKVERSHRHEIPIVYKNSKPDKAKEYDYRVGL